MSFLALVSPLHLSPPEPLVSKTHHQGVVQGS